MYIRGWRFVSISVFLYFYSYYYFIPQIETSWKPVGVRMLQSELPEMVVEHSSDTGRRGQQHP